MYWRGFAFSLQRGFDVASVDDERLHGTSGGISAVRGPTFYREQSQLLVSRHRRLDADLKEGVREFGFDDS